MERKAGSRLQSQSDVLVSTHRREWFGPSSYPQRAPGCDSIALLDRWSSHLALILRCARSGLPCLLVLVRSKQMSSKTVLDAPCPAAAGVPPSRSHRLGATATVGLLALALSTPLSSAPDDCLYECEHASSRGVRWFAGERLLPLSRSGARGPSAAVAEGARGATKKVRWLSAPVGGVREQQRT
jgi:hypothetical protein